MAINEKTVDKVMKSVVYLRTKEKAQGSGWIFNKRKKIIATNHHVIEGEKEIEVRFYNLESTYGKVIYSIRSLDIAFIWVNNIPKELNVEQLKIMDKNKIKLAMPTFAFGHPYGKNQKFTVTSGTISKVYDDTYQTDTPINPGNSGGPLVNRDGDLIGMNSSGFIDAQNLNFAIKILHIKHKYDECIQNLNQDELKSNSYCIVCGHSNNKFNSIFNENNSNCDNCGYDLIGEFKYEQKHALPPDYCVACGERILTDPEDIEHFIIEEEKPIICCDNCNYGFITLHDKYCPQCGEKIGEFE